MAVLNAKELAAYIQKKYEEEKQMQISPIRLQKSLYFLFAYWGGLVRKSSQYPLSVEENFSKTYDDYLFDADIEAWVYGPVIPEVYHETDVMSFYNENIFKGKEKVKEFVDGLLEELFGVSDFTLVEISHNDNAWKSNFSHVSQYHNNIISKEDIIDEYVSK